MGSAMRRSSAAWSHTNDLLNWQIFLGDKMYLYSEFETRVKAKLDEDSVSKTRDQSITDGSHNGGGNCSRTFPETEWIMRDGTRDREMLTKIYAPPVATIAA
jgi:hypothetical protein